MINVIGDVCLDIYTKGEPSGLSPEFPVPVIKQTAVDCAAGMGGNVAANVRALGGEVTLYAHTADDVAGRRLNAALEGIELKATHGTAPFTTTKTRIQSSDGHHYIRIDRDAYINHPLDTLPTSGTAVVADYGKGTVTEGIMEQLRAASTLLLIDGHPTAGAGLYQGADILKLNEREAREWSGFHSLNPHELTLHILEMSGAKAVVITLGEHGMLYADRDEKRLTINAKRVKALDVCGAGDTVIASLAVDLTKGLDIEDALYNAAGRAAEVVEQAGTAVVRGK